MSEQKATLDQIAARTGVTKITVSRALKGQSGVGEGLRKKIIQVAAELGYEYGRLRESPRTLRMAFVTPKRFFLSTDSFYHAIYYHLNALCHGARIDLSVFVIEREDEVAGRLPDRIDSADGLFLGGELGRPFLQALRGLAIPSVTIDYDDIEFPSDCVIIDNFRMGALAAEYLVKKGYGTIGFVGTSGHSSNIADRILGYRKVLERQGLPFHETWVVDNYDRASDNYVVQITLPDPLPEAFLCHCDRAAFYFIESLRSRGVAVPAQVAVVSFDNTELAAGTNPPLTSVEISKKDFAEAAFRLVLDRLDNPGRPVQRVYLDTAVVERDSVPDRKAAATRT